MNQTIPNSAPIRPFKAFDKKNSHDNWATPRKVYEQLDQEFHFNDDPCPLNPEGNGGLDREWGTSTYVNPPYSKPAPWCQKAIEESRKGKTVVMLLRGDTSTIWFHEYVYGKAELRFVRGRLHFNEEGPAKFPSLIAIYRPGASA